MLITKKVNISGLQHTINKIKFKKNKLKKSFFSYKKNYYHDLVIWIIIIIMSYKIKKGSLRIK